MMPYKDPSKRRRWETTNAQREKAAERKARERTKTETLKRLVPVERIIRACRAQGREPNLHPNLIAQVAEHQAAINAYIARQDSTPIEVEHQPRQPAKGSAHI